MTALMEAAGNNRVEAMVLLLDRGADINHKDNVSVTRVAIGVTIVCSSVCGMWGGVLGVGLWFGLAGKEIYRNCNFFIFFEKKYFVI